ncbi:hypothetical protein COLO4_32731 [Corchorus olitorius]|uniref:Uncharacterized protein n=1 Tax=Corchorus olitorius TaxID=93759 RepID=A0A1R3GYM0_9ROSI|nr:hypothetical protein COLO4_32731 [Corchorus olitorius]
MKNRGDNNGGFQVRVFSLKVAGFSAMLLLRETERVFKERVCVKTNGRVKGEDEDGVMSGELAW